VVKVTAFADCPAVVDMDAEILVSGSENTFVVTNYSGLIELATGVGCAVTVATRDVSVSEEELETMWRGQGGHVEDDCDEKVAEGKFVSGFAAPSLEYAKTLANFHLRKCPGKSLGVAYKMAVDEGILPAVPVNPTEEEALVALKGATKNEHCEVLALVVTEVNALKTIVENHDGLLEMVADIVEAHASYEKVKNLEETVNAQAAVIAELKATIANMATLFGQLATITK
jgi:hypothetical protein